MQQRLGGLELALALRPERSRGQPKMGVKPLVISGGAAIGIIVIFPGGTPLSVRPYGRQRDPDDRAALALPMTGM